MDPQHQCAEFHQVGEISDRIARCATGTFLSEGLGTLEHPIAYAVTNTSGSKIEVRCLIGWCHSRETPQKTATWDVHAPCLGPDLEMELESQQCWEFWCPNHLDLSVPLRYAGRGQRGVETGGWGAEAISFPLNSYVNCLMNGIFPGELERKIQTRSGGDPSSTQLRAGAGCLGRNFSRDEILTGRVILRPRISDC